MTNQLATKPEAGGKTADGFCTPKEDKSPQKMSVLPHRVLPIIFLPGIMGSNLRINAKRQALLEKSNNIAWRPDRSLEALALVYASPATRQLQLDEDSTEVDIYAPDAPTGASETPGKRHDNCKIGVALNVGIDTPLLMDDPTVLGKKAAKTKEQKARERGWGEVYFGSYRTILEMCEERLNEAFVKGSLHPWWRKIVGVDPRVWRAHPQHVLTPLTENELRMAVTGCWFPVHAMGYNWLASNRKSGALTAKRISSLIDRYRAQGYQCEKVILVTHSMGGLVARAVIHPHIGNLAEKVLGVVHGVMPAIGAAAAYKRMRCGFEEALMGLDPSPKVLGNFGAEVTAVLGNSPGGLELLPSESYGNDWLRVVRKDSVIISLPKKGDPYEEIYKLRNKWYGLLREHWLNPAKVQGRGFDVSCAFLDEAKQFHKDISGAYHPISYAHYGADTGRPSWQRVEWVLDSSCVAAEAETLAISADSQQGVLKVRAPNWPVPVDFTVKLAPSAGAGDQTVPLHSAEHQLQSGKFSGIFRQIGYEHQGSYKNSDALSSTLFSLVRIAQKMKWNGA